jgi:sarcosine oxidase
MNDYDVIVLGLGAMGAATTYHLARRGHRVLGIDAHPEGHAFGSSHGDHRMIRRSHPDPLMRPLVDRAFVLWRELEESAGVPLMRIYGELAVQSAEVLDIWGDGDVSPVPTVLDECRLRSEFPGFDVPSPLVATYEAEAGLLRPEVAVSAHLRLARDHGAQVLRPQWVREWRPDGTGVTVRTDSATFAASALVVTAGPWAPVELAAVGLPLTTVRIVNAYVTPSRPDLWSLEAGAPNFMLDVPEGTFYGLPAMDGMGLKIGMDDTSQPTTPETIDRVVHESDLAPLRAVLDRYLPGASGPVERTLTCMYTVTPDWNFVVEQHPEHPQISYGAGFSGMGFKFSPVIGEILADLTESGRSSYDLSGLESNRFTHDG